MLAENVVCKSPSDMVQYPRKMENLTAPLQKPKYSHRPNLFGEATINICIQGVKLTRSNKPNRLGSLLLPFHLKTKADLAFGMCVCVFFFLA
jgi:hypothetical protein